MNRNIITVGLSLALSLGIAPVAFAQYGSAVGSVSGTVTAGGVHASVTASTSAGVKADLISRAKDRADQEITRRIDNLTKLKSRLSDMKHISASDQASLEASVQAQIDAMNTLQSQIAADNSTTTLRADIQSITKSYRIYALVIPQSTLIAAADRVLAIASDLQTLSGKLSTRIAAAGSAGMDVTAMNASLTDMNAKITDAQAQANAAVSEVVVLKPDNGDKTLMAANTATLKDARSKVQVAQQDIVAARKDAGDIVKALGGAHSSASATTTSSASTTP